MIVKDKYDSFNATEYDLELPNVKLPNVDQVKDTLEILKLNRVYAGEECASVIRWLRLNALDSPCALCELHCDSDDSDFIYCGKCNLAFHGPCAEHLQKDLGMKVEVLPGLQDAEADDSRDSIEWTCPLCIYETATKPASASTPGLNVHVTL